MYQNRNMMGGQPGYGFNPQPGGMPQPNPGMFKDHGMGYGVGGGFYQPENQPEMTAAVMPRPGYGFNRQPDNGHHGIMPIPGPTYRLPDPGYGGRPTPGYGYSPRPMPMPGYGGMPNFGGDTMPVPPGPNRFMGSLPGPDVYADALRRRADRAREFGFAPENQPEMMPMPGFGGGGMPMPFPGYGGGRMPQPDGGGEMNPGYAPIPQRTFNNNNPFYNAKGNLRMRYRPGGQGDIPMGAQGGGFGHPTGY